MVSEVESISLLDTDVRSCLRDKEAFKLNVALQETSLLKSKDIIK